MQEKGAKSKGIEGDICFEMRLIRLLKGSSPANISLQTPLLFLKKFPCNPNTMPIALVKCLTNSAHKHK